MENAPNKCRGGIITVHRKPARHPLLEDTNKNMVKGLKDICSMRWENHNLVGGRQVLAMYRRTCALNSHPSKEPLVHVQVPDLVAPLQSVGGELSIYIYEITPRSYTVCLAF
jgi:hypothetical protein